MEKKGDLVRPKGTRDFLPEEMRIRNHIEKKVRNVFKKFGYEEIMTPIFENLELFEIKSGEKFKEHVYTFGNPKRGLEDDDEEKPNQTFILRPELTAPTCRFYSTSKLSHLPKPLKLFYIGQCFRWDRPEPGRYREFWQAGVELLGSSLPIADAEVITLACKVLEEIGIKDYLISLNDINILRQLLFDHDIEVDLQNKIFGVIDSVGSAISKYMRDIIDIDIDDLRQEFRKDLMALDVQDSLIEELLSLVYIKGKREALDEAKIFIDKYPRAKEALETSPINLILKNLDLYNIKNYEIDFSIARGLDYYTGIVFEIYVDALGKQRQICGGGRYDNLVQEYGGVETPATGFGIGFDRLCIAAENLNLIDANISKQPRAEVFILSLVENDLCLKVAKDLRDANISTEIDLIGKNIKKGLSLANTLNMSFAILIGKKELEKGVVSIKNLRTEEQREAKIEDVVSSIRTWMEDN